MSSLFSFARTSVFDASANGSVLGALEGDSLGAGHLQGLLSTWLNLDLTTVAAILTICGVITGVSRSLAGLALKLYWWITRFFTASVSIAASDRLNREVLNWLGANVLLRQGTRVLTAGSERVMNDANYYRHVPMLMRNDDLPQMDKQTPIQYLPTFGIIWFVHDRNVFLVKRIRNDRYGSSSSYLPDEYSGAPDGTEPLVVLCLGLSVAPIKRFLETCRKFAEDQKAEFVTIRSCKSQDYFDCRWNSVVLRPARSLETVHFDEATKAGLVADIRTYLDPETRRFYTTRGIPYRRGYLLHGPPGTGKTSLSLALASCFELELYMLHIPSIKDDTQLETLFSLLPPQCIVLLEDVDAVCIRKRGPPVSARRGENDSEDGGSDDDDNDDDDDDGSGDSDSDASSSRNGFRARRRGYVGGSYCTLSGLLNVLDGVTSQEGRIVLMTSNFAETLDKALVRPGRIDRSVFLGNISPRSAELMFLRMFAPNGDKFTDDEPCGGREKSQLAELALRFSAAIPDNTFSPAQLQGYLLTHREAPVQAVENIEAWVDEEKKRMDAAELREKRVAERAEKKRNERKSRALARALSSVGGGKKVTAET